MTKTVLKVRMLGEFKLSYGEAQVNDSSNRSRKIWLLLAYMIYNRNRSIPPEDLIGFLWGEAETSANPGNALKTMFHRLRNLLDELEPNGGRNLILHRSGTYAWNNDIPLELDIDSFDRLCRKGASLEGEARLQCWREATTLYGGDFLDKMSSESWVVPIAAYYRALYNQTVLELLPMLEERGAWAEASALCREALAQDPYQEDLYRFLMRALIHQGEQQEAVRIYEDMSELLLTNFGVMPAAETRALYREANQTVNGRTLSPDLILEQLREDSPARGALVCDYDMFIAIYHSVARAVARSGDAVHLSLFSAEGEEDKPLSKRSLDKVMENLQTLIRTSLRRGDILSRCSVSQFILLLPQANYENSHMICNRITRAFNRQYPHSPALLRFSVHPLEPNL